MLAHEIQNMQCLFHYCHNSLELFRWHRIPVGSNAPSQDGAEDTASSRVVGSTKLCLEFRSNNYVCPNLRMKIYALLM
jgi:hypothetical protein